MIAETVIATLSGALVAAVLRAIKADREAVRAEDALYDMRRRAEHAERCMWAERRLRRRIELAAHEARTGERVRYEDIDWEGGP